MLTQADFLAPITRQEFHERYLSKDFLLIRKNHGQPHDFFTWQDLNELLNRKRFDKSQVRLVNKDDDCDPDQLFSHRTDTKTGQKIAYLNSYTVNQQMAKGATLVVNGVDEYHEGIARMVAMLENLVNEKIQANLYACFQPSHGFGVHWDNHDVFVVQVMGSKAWQVYPTTDNKEALAEGIAPLWQGQLNHGDVLYIPRGFWHFARSIGQTVHITFGFTNRRVEHYLKWALKQLTNNGPANKHSLLQTDLNLFRQGATQPQLLAQLKEALATVMTEDSLAHYFQQTDAKAPERPYFNFPYVLGEPLAGQTKLAFNVPRLQKQAIEYSGSNMAFTAFNRRWSFSAKAKKAIEYLIEAQNTSVDAMVGQATELDLTENQVEGLIKDLLAAGLVKSFA